MSGTQPGTFRSLTSLNDGALLYIFSFLYGWEALGIALTSRHLHDLAIPRVAAAAMCLSSIAITHLCNYMLQGPRPRARYLEILDVQSVILDDTNDAGVPHGDLLADLLAAAQNLRQLALPFLMQSLGPRSRIGDAIIPMRNLVDLDLLNADDHALNLLSEISGSLRRLKIWYGTTSTENALLRALTKHTRLQSLGLRDFRPSAPLTHTSRPNAPALFPSLRSPSIALHDVEATLFIDLFPHLRHLALPLRKSLHPPLALDRDTASRWPPLQELYIDISDASLAQHRIRQAEKIFFTVPVQYHELLAIQDPLRAMLRAASPVRLSMIIWVEPGLLHTLVSILAALPRLRTLTLSMQRLQHHYHADPEQEWLVDNVATLKTLQLENLLIVANVEIDRFDSPTPQHLEQEQRSATPVPLHVRLTRTVPTLRLFGVASVYRTTNTDPPEEFDPRYRNLNDPANLWYQPSWVSLIGRGRYHRRWWSVGDGGELTELSPREAKEMDIGSLFT